MLCGRNVGPDVAGGLTLGGLNCCLRSTDPSMETPFVDEDIGTLEMADDSQ